MRGFSPSAAGNVHGVLATKGATDMYIGGGILTILLIILLIYLLA
jgi:hypothetical protein